LLGGTCWIDLPMPPRAGYRAVFFRTASVAACALEPPRRWSGSSGSIASTPSWPASASPRPAQAFLP
jgi:hypothetical protein